MAVELRRFGDVGPFLPPSTPVVCCKCRVAAFSTSGMHQISSSYLQHTNMRSGQFIMPIYGPNNLKSVLQRVMCLSKHVGPAIASNLF